MIHEPAWRRVLLLLWLLGVIARFGPAFLAAFFLSLLALFFFRRR